MASASTGWKCTHSASIVSSTNTSATIRVTCYWKNINWTYNINYVSAWVYCNGTPYQVKNSGSVNATSSSSGSYSMGYYDFTVSKGTASKNVSCYAKITSNSSYVSGTKSSSSTSVSVSAKPSYTVSYNANGGSGAPTNQTKWYGTNLTLSSTTPARTGYSFSKWNTASDGSGTSYNPGATYSGNAALALYAIWTANTYTVSYNANGGSGAPSDQTKTYGIDLTLSSTKPTRTNYNFLGWSTSANGGVVYQAGGTYSNNSAVTLYAVWELAYVKPRINNFFAQRCASNGVFSESGTYIKVTFDWDTDHDVNTVMIQYKTQTGSWTDVFVTASGTSGSVNKIIGDGDISTETSYSVRAYVSDSTTDSSHATYSREISIGTVKFPIDVKKGGTGVAIGKASEKDAFEVGMDMYDKSGQLISCKDFGIYDSESQAVRVVCCAGIQIGGIYQIAISFNYNTSGSEYYRATVYAILSVPCGYNNSTVVVRPQILNMSTYYGINFDSSNILSAHIEGGGTEINVGSFNNLVYIYVQYTAGIPTADWKISVRPLVE